MRHKAVLTGAVPLVVLFATLTLTIGLAQAGVCTTDIPMGAIAPARPIWCEVLGAGRDTHVAGSNSWSDDFNHGQSMARLNPAYVEGFIGNGDVRHFQHNDHWMLDIESHGGNALIGAWMRPNRSFRLQSDGSLVVEFEVAGPIAGTRSVGTISDSWPEFVLSTAPAPPGMQPWGSALRRSGTYLYEGFPGFWTFGCRMQQSRHPICALYRDDFGTAGTKPSRVWEINQNGGEVRFELGGGPGGLSSSSWKGCDSVQDPDVVCRNKFRWEIRANEVKLFTNGVLYYHAGLIDSEMNNILQASGGVYVFFGDFAYNMDPGRPLRFHWDHVAINPSLASGPSTNPVPPTAPPTTPPAVQPTSTRAPAATPTRTPTAVPISPPSPPGGGGGGGGSNPAPPPNPAPQTSAPQAPAAGGGGGGGGGAGGSASAPPIINAPALAAPAQPASVAPAVAAAAARSASASIDSLGGSAVFELETGRQMSISIGANLASELAGSSFVAQYNADPALPNDAAAGSLGGGNAVPVGRPFQLHLGIRDQASGAVTSIPAASSEACVGLSLPVLVHPGQPDTQFAWLMEVKQNGQFFGYLRLPGEFDGASNTLNYCVEPEALRDTLFLPVLIVPAYLENFDGAAHMWSAPTDGADDFGLVGPQFTTLTVVGPQVGDRIFVFNSFSGGYGWVDASAVGPASAAPVVQPEGAEETEA